MILWEQKVSHKSGDVPFKNLNKLCWLIICLRLLINCYHSFLSLLFQFVWGLYISVPTAVDLQLNPSRASAVENVRISLHHGSWGGHDACSGSPHVWRSTSSTSWRPPTNSSSLPSLCFIFVFIKIAGSDFRCESLRCAIFPFTSFQNSHESAVSIYYFMQNYPKSSLPIGTSKDKQRRVFFVRVVYPTRSCSLQNRRYLFAFFAGNEAGMKRQSRAPIITGSMSNSQIKLCVAWS